MNDETPVRIEKHVDSETGHHAETRIFAREIHETYCDEPGCEFYNKLAAQGVCHTMDVWAKEHLSIEFIEKRATEFLFEIRRMFAEKPREDYVEYLERIFESNLMNYDLLLDECIRLRAENAKLRDRLGEYPAKQS